MNKTKKYAIYSVRHVFNRLKIRIENLTTGEDNYLDLTEDDAIMLKFTLNKLLRNEEITENENYEINTITKEIKRKEIL